MVATLISDHWPELVRIIIPANVYAPWSTTYGVDLFTNDVILDFDSALRWNMFRIDIQIEFTKGIFFLEVVFPSTKAHFDLTHPS